jgi:hypothetical protein
MLDALIVFFVFFFPPIVFFIWYFFPKKSARNSAVANGVGVDGKGFGVASSASTQEQSYNINGLPMAGGVDVSGNAFGVM